MDFENSRNSYYIDRGHMLRDNALKFYRGQAYDIPQKPIENGQYMNQNGHFENSRNSDSIDRGHMLPDNALKCAGFMPIKFYIFFKILPYCQILPFNHFFKKSSYLGNRRS